MRIGLQLAGWLAGHVAVAVVTLTAAVTAHCIMLHVPSAAFAVLSPAMLSPGCAMLAKLCHHCPVLAGAFSIPSGGTLVPTTLAMWLCLPSLAHGLRYPSGAPAVVGAGLQVHLVR